MNPNNKKTISKDGSINELRRCWICEEIHYVEKTIDKTNEEIILKCLRTNQIIAIFPLEGEKIPKTLYYKEFLEDLKGEGNGQRNS